jgi:hypothetical protein
MKPGLLGILKTTHQRAAAVRLAEVMDGIGFFNSFFGDNG